MRAYLRLLKTLRPYRGSLAAAIACMVVYAAMSGVSLGLIAPFMRVLFERPPAAGTAATLASPDASAATPDPRPAPAPTATPSGPTPGAPRPSADPLAAMGADRLNGWPEPLRGWMRGAFLDARPLVALERLCVFILVVLLIKNLADYLQSFLMVSVEQAAIRDLRSRLFAHLHTLPLGFFHGKRTGMLVSRLTTDLEYLRASLAAGISNLIKDSLTLIVCVTWVFVASWKLALFSLVVLPPVAFALVTIGRKMRRRSTQAQERMADVTSILHETVVGARVVKAFGAEERESARFDRANQGFYRAFVRLRRVSAAARPVSEYAVVMVAVAMLWFGGRQIFVGGDLEPQQFVLFVTALLSTISPLKSLSEVNAHVQQGVSAAERVFELLDTRTALADRAGARPLASFRHEVRYEHVTFAYPGDPPVVHDADFRIGRGEVVALVGASGAGKSTLMDLLARFDDPSDGRITLDGVDLRDATTASLRAQLAIVTQETVLFHDTVRANLAYGRPEASDDDVRAAARAAYAHDFIERLPQGYDTVIGERGARLSGGERQRLAIARALLKNAPILLLDEATSSLDTESERMVQAALDRLMEHRTTLVIAHRLSTVQHADRIVVLERGRIVAQGTHAELVERDGPYRRLYDLQFVA